MKNLIFALTMLLMGSSSAQITQNIRGTVFDKHSQTSLPGANVVVTTTDPMAGAASDINGRFIIKKILCVFSRVPRTWKVLGFN